MRKPNSSMQFQNENDVTQSFSVPNTKLQKLSECIFLMMGPS